MSSATCRAQEDRALQEYRLRLRHVAGRTNRNNGVCGAAVHLRAERRAHLGLLLQPLKLDIRIIWRSATRSLRPAWAVSLLTPSVASRQCDSSLRPVETPPTRQFDLVPRPTGAGVEPWAKIWAPAASGCWAAELLCCLCVLVRAEASLTAQMHPCESLRLALDVSAEEE